MKLGRKLLKKVLNKVARKAARKSRTKRTRRSRAPLSKAILGAFHSYVANDPIGPRKFVKFMYADNFTFTTGTAGIAGNEQVMRLNSLFDPDLTNIGHQPLYYDQFCPTLYRKYKVNGVKVELTFDAPSASGTFICCQLQNSSESFTVQGKTFQQLKEEPMTVCKLLSSTGSQQTKITQYLPIWAVEGVTKQQFKSQIEDGTYDALYNTSPADTPLIRFTAGSLSGSAGVTVQCSMRLTYYTMLFERVVPAQS